MECLRSLERVSCVGVGIYLVDNGSIPPVRPALEAAGIRANLIEVPRNMGFTGGHNLGGRKALEDGAEAILFLNNDTVADPGFLGPLIDAVSGDPSIGIAAPKIYFYGGDRVYWAHGAKVGRFTARSPHIGVYRKDEGQFDAVVDVDRVTGCAMFVRRDFLERVGFLDERFFAYSEDIDWCLRARRAGYRVVVVKESVIWHKGHRSSGRMGRPFIAYLQARNHLLMLRKHSGYFAAGGVFALIYFLSRVFAGVALGIAAWARTGNKMGLECALAMVYGVVDHWAGRYGPPARKFS